jgi:hypothetical protein
VEDAGDVLRVPSAAYPIPMVHVGSLPAGDNAIGRAKLLGNDGVTAASVFNLTNAKPLAVRMVDGAGDALNWPPQAQRLTLLSSAARGTSPSVPTQNTPFHTAVQVALHVTAGAGANLSFYILGIDDVSGIGYPLTVATPAITGVPSYTVIELGRGCTAATTATTPVRVATFLTPKWSAVVTHNNANSITYALYALIVP